MSVAEILVWISLSLFILSVINFVVSDIIMSSPKFKVKDFNKVVIYFIISCIIAIVSVTLFLTTYVIYRG